MPELTTKIEEIKGVPALFGARPADVDVLLGLKSKKNLHTTILRYDSSDELRRFYFGLVQVVADGLGIHKDDLHAQLKLKVGLVKNYIMGEKGLVVELKSIARTAIDNAALWEYINFAEEVIFSRYVPGIKRKDVYRMVLERFGAKRPKQ